MVGVGKELGQAAGTVVVDTIADARGALGKLFGPALTEFGGMLGDTVREWRFNNLASIMARVHLKAKDRGLSAEALKALPFGDAVKVMEAASEEEDETVQDLWARLLANAADPSRAESIGKVHIDILKAVSAPDAAFMELLYTVPRPPRMSYAAYQEWEQELDEAAQHLWRTYSEEVRATSIQNLRRLGCVTFRPYELTTSGLLGRLPRNDAVSGNWAVVDRRKFEKLLQDMLDMIGAAAGINEYRANDLAAQMQNRPRERLYMLTPLGEGLMKACA